MKKKIAALLLAAVGLLSNACEQHKWSETQKLFPKEEEHGEKAEKEGAEHTKAEPSKEAKDEAKPAEAKKE